MDCFREYVGVGVSVDKKRKQCGQEVGGGRSKIGKKYVDILYGLPSYYKQYI